MFLASIILFIAHHALGLQVKPLDPEEMLFIYTRCAEEVLPLAKDNLTVLQTWMNWELEPNIPATECFARCVLVKSKLYDPTEKKFMPELIQLQHEKYKKYTKLPQSEIEKIKYALKDIKAEKHSCKLVYDAYKPVHLEFKEETRALFHGNPEITKSIYKDLADNIRQKNQSMLEFCEKKFYRNDPKRLCKARKYEILTGNQFKRLIQCNFKGLRYITGENVINEFELMRDFEQVGKKSNIVMDALKKCDYKSFKGDETAFKVYDCLLKNPATKESFKEAFDYREIRSRDYAYKLKYNSRKYNREEIIKAIKEIDDGLCK